jgi:hypothetical protein
MSSLSRWFSTALALVSTSTPFNRRTADVRASSGITVTSDVTIAGVVDNTLVIQNRMIAPDGWERLCVFALVDTLLKLTV